MRYDDWGERSPRWAGIRSEHALVHHTPVHVLRAEAAPEAPSEAPTQLLVHGIAGGAWHWLDVIHALSAHGPVVAIDLLGCGRTVPPEGHQVDPSTNAAFLQALSDALELDEVVVHGMSMGGLVSLLYADRDPDRVRGLVLVAPALTRPLAPVENLGWQTVGKLALAALPPLARGLARLSTTETLAPVAHRAFALTNTASQRWSQEMASIRAEDQRAVHTQTWRLEAIIAGWEAILTSMFVEPRPVEEAIDRVAVPTLVVWGDRDELVERAVVDHALRRRPDWALQVLSTTGHSPPQEAPDRYAEVVSAWLLNGQAA